MVQPIPHPHLLDPERITSDDREDMTLAEHRSRARQLDEALHESCAYATQLWQQLDADREYLFESLPSDPRDPGETPHAGASPTGPDDQEGWRRWAQAYASTTSVLAGPHGDSGFGMHAAKQAAQDRRTAPNLRLAESMQHGAIAEATRAEPNRGAGRGAQLRFAAVAVLAVLAARVLRRPRAA